MSRTMLRLRDWPDCLKRLTLDELRRERSYWQERLQGGLHRQARKSIEQRVRDIEAEIDRRASDDE